MDEQGSTREPTADQSPPDPREQEAAAENLLSAGPEEAEPPAAFLPAGTVEGPFLLWEEEPREEKRFSWRSLFVSLALLGILLLALAFRLPKIGLIDPDGPLTAQDRNALTISLREGGRQLAIYSWDEGVGLHPDERFLTMVAQAIAFPEPCRAFLPHFGSDDSQSPPGDLGACFSAYLDSSTSTLNPRNRGHGLWVYGSLPMTLMRAILESFSVYGYSQASIVGRLLSILADLAAVLLTFFLGRRIYGTRAGLLAALFLALSVLNIQGAHFFTVDIVTALLTLACVYLAVVIAEGKGTWGTFVLLGPVFGLAVSSKVNTASFALIIALAGAVRVRRRLKEEGDEALWPAIRATALGLAVAALLSLVTFRLAQPDAFTGPGLLDVHIEPRYWANLETVQGLIGGEIDYYPSHQWTERPALWFPWKNMVLWGMGLPLGLAAWAGVVWAGWQLVRRRDLRPLVPLAWTLLLFLYQGVQFVKTMRYFLPLYPLLCLFAAHLLWSLWDWARARETLPRWRTFAAGGLLGLVVLGTLLWAWGFVQIYRKPITRITATRWIYKNLTTDQGAWLTLDNGRELPIPIPNAHLYSPGGPGTATPFTMPTDGTARQLTLTHLQDPAASPEDEQIEVLIAADPAGQQVLARGLIVGNYTGPAGDGAPGTLLLPSLALQGGQTYYLHLRSVQGQVRTWAVTLANEQWDDPIPRGGVDGKDGFSSTYRGLDLFPYAEDTPQKVRELLQQLANTDYLCLTSNRLYDSIPRLPMRYPVTTRYYQALFDGSLGFERAATFTSYPTLFAWSVPAGLADTSDEEREAQQTGWYGLPIPDQVAEEAFSVYDHPKVQIFRRTEGYDPDAAYAMLTEAVDWNDIARIRPIEVPAYRRGKLPGSSPSPTPKTDLLLTEQEWDTQLQGGTWSDIFDRNSWTNRLALPVWLLLVELLGLAALPLTHLLVGRLADGGYLPAKALGFLLLGFLSWLLAATKLLPYARTTIVLVLFSLLLLGAVLAWFRRKELLELFRTRWRLILLEEALFLGAFLLFLLIRLGNPDLWHPVFGGEKPMELAYINAIVRSTTFPPYDPWFAGGYINYYYFGFILVATPIKLLGIVPGVAYNLALPLLYALTCGGAFTVVYHLVSRGTAADGWDRRAIRYGLLGVAFVAVLGNLGEFLLLIRKLGEASELQFSSSIPGLAPLVKGIVGLTQVTRKGLPLSGSWYWDASRVLLQLPGGPPRGNEINEFPWFTFLYADLHPHMIALPYTLLILTQIVALVKDRGRGSRSLLALLPPPWALLGMLLVLGTLRAANSWDFPGYFLLAVIGWGIALYERQRRLNWRVAVGPVLLAPILWIFTSLIFQPYWARYGEYYNRFVPWTGERTHVWEYLVINGIFLFVIVTYLVGEAFGRGAREGPLHLVGLVWRFWDRLPVLFRRLQRWEGVGIREEREPGRRRRGRALPVLAWGCLVLLLIELFIFLPGAKGPDGLPLPAEDIPVLSFLQRLRGEPLVGWLILLAVLGVLLFFRRRQRGEDRLAILFMLAGLGISGFVELWVMTGDIARQNTFFKFYMQVWVLLAVSAAAVLPRLWDRLASWSPQPARFWRALLFVLIGMGALYPLFATPAKILDRFPGNALGPGLDGEAFMWTETYRDEFGPLVLAEDATAMRWLEENVEGSPVVLEGITCRGPFQCALYRWGSRFSRHTGLPTVIGWDWHQRQQRAAASDAGVEQRVEDVVTLYSTTDIPRTLALLRQYRVSYVVVGQLERDYFPAEGIAKFEQMVGTYLERVYPAGSGQAPTSFPAQQAGSTHPAALLAAPYPSPSAAASSYPQTTPAASSMAYPEPAPLPEEPAPPAETGVAPGEGTILYRVLPSVWQQDLGILPAPRLRAAGPARQAPSTGQLKIGNWGFPPIRIAVPIPDPPVTNLPTTNLPITNTPNRTLPCATSCAS